MSKSDELRAELALIELEERLVAVKADRSSPEYAEVKAEVRAARQAHREARGETF